MAKPSWSRRKPISRPWTMGSHSHRPTPPPPLISLRRHLFSPLFDEGGGGVAAALVVLVLVVSPPDSAAASRSPPSPDEDDGSPLPEAPSPSRSTFARAAGGQRRTRRCTSASPRPRGGTADIRIDAAPLPAAAAAAAGRWGKGRRSERDGDAIGNEARVSAAAQAIRRRKARTLDVLACGLSEKQHHGARPTPPLLLRTCALRNRFAGGAGGEETREERKMRKRGRKEVDTRRRGMEGKGRGWRPFAEYRHAVKPGC